MDILSSYCLVCYSLNNRWCVCVCEREKESVCVGGEGGGGGDSSSFTPSAS